MTLAALFFAILLLGFMIGGLRGAVWVPARTNDTEKIIRSLDLPDGMNVFEFGCGDGRNLRLIERLLPTAKISAIEINPVMWLIAEIATRFRTNIKLGDGWHNDLSDQNVVITFLTPPFMERFESKMRNELNPGSLVISYAFKLPSLQPIKVQNNYFVYRIA
jgi:trans-aconitate methyltransferase